MRLECKRCGIMNGNLEHNIGITTKDKREFWTCLRCNTKNFIEEVIIETNLLEPKTEVEK